MEHPPNLPEDIVTEILARISALQLLKFRRVCRKWNDLISMDYFHNTHLIRSKEPDSPSPPMLLVQSFGQKMVIFDESEQRDVPNFNVDDDDNFKVDDDDNLRFNIMRIICSYDGLIVIKRLDFDYFIYNPVTGETVMINNSKTGSQYFVYALFFNPWINEYCVILVKKGHKCCSTFEILNLGSPPYRCKPLKTPNKKIGYCNRTDHPVVINNANIYWQLRYISCENFILAFNIKAEEFSFLPHPHPYSLNGCLELNDLRLRHRNMHIADIHGHLSFVQITITNSVTVIFNIWRSTVAAAQAHDQQQQSPNWIKIHSVIINNARRQFNDFFIWSDSRFEVLVIQNGEMLFVNRVCNSVFAYNFQLRTVRFIRRLHVINNGFLLYVPSFASLKNCVSKICI